MFVSQLVGHLGRIKRHELLEGDVSPGVGFGVSKAQARPSLYLSLFLLPVDQDVNSQCPMAMLPAVMLPTVIIID